MLLRIRSGMPLYIVFTSLFSLVGLKTLGALIPNPFVMNLSASMPKGVYRIMPVRGIGRGMLVLFVLPEDIKLPLRGRDWFREDLPLIKPVAALPGDIVCTRGTVKVNGKRQGKVYKSDYLGRRLTSRRGCITVSAKSFVPLSTHSKRSFDGRYFGEVPQDSILGEAVPVFTW